ncbi:RmlC-like cupin domain-containing protein [Lasiosphaeria miniovina]|uniref:RmlC-like cupin domain-containing protein n=1 Tax=Lasiosphaeria miniovina TaxID=1954250 RepID=A0AA40B6R6_9PEZI|nr:RmlC-like cupin domain-containing protein [Lasiosphaeria miniovina]KAK0728627.1 RmlC-like cupin domain-containing protein [Lasiosphaeria miniovina]
MAELAHLKPCFAVPEARHGSLEKPEIQIVIDTLRMQPHSRGGGGYRAETDRHPSSVVAGGSEFPPDEAPSSPSSKLRSASSTSLYLITPNSPQSYLHRTRERTMHTLHRGRGRIVVIHDADESTKTGARSGGVGYRVESFVVGHNVAAGERLQWVVEAGKYRASFLLPDRDGEMESKAGLLVSETSVPGLVDSASDREFLDRDGLRKLLRNDDARELEWLARPEQIKRQGP